VPEHLREQGVRWIDARSVHMTSFRSPTSSAIRTREGTFRGAPLWLLIRRPSHRARSMRSSSTKIWQAPPSASFAQTSLAALVAATDALRGKFGDPRR
jgi:hypothetical protein